MSEDHISILKRLLEVLAYDPSTGIFTWRKNQGNVKCGSRAGGLDVEGYRRIKHKKQHFKEHRLAWLFTYGVWPEKELDHINGVRSDNRIANLREASNRENHQNRRSNRNSTSKYLGVSYCTNSKKFKAGITVNKCRTHLGYFSSEEAAYAAYCEAKARLHPFNPTPLSQSST